MKMLVAAGEPYHLGRLLSPTKLRFGGLWVEYGPGNKFYLGIPPHDYPSAMIDEADVTDTIKFMLHHFKPCYSNSFRSADSIEEGVNMAIAALHAGQHGKCEELLLAMRRALEGH
ncbi:MAG: hypothetical protein AMXMBFR7_30790 [Planctomycetota bacterium]